jgi:protein ImuB
MLRAISIVLPNWSIDLRRRSKRQNVETSQHQKPGAIDACAMPGNSGSNLDCAGNDAHASSGISLLLVDVEHGVQIVRHSCEQCQARGIYPGITLAHARALLETDQCEVQDDDPHRDAAALGKVAAWALRYAPIAAIDLPDGVLLDIAGCQRLYRTPQQLLWRIVRDLDRLGFYARVAAGPTFGSAWAMARFDPGRISCVDESDVRDRLCDLPIQSLRLDHPTIAALHEVEIRTIAHIIDLPRSELARRYGQNVLWRLDQALGRAPEVIQPVRPFIPPSVQRSFDGPVRQLQGIQLTVQELIEQLMDKQLRQERGVRRLDLELLRIDTHPLSTSLTFSQPTRNPKHAWALLRPRVEAMNMGFGVERITLTAARLGRLLHQQQIADELTRRMCGTASPPCDRVSNANSQIATATPNESRLDAPFSSDIPNSSRAPNPAVGELIDTLCARLGCDRVLRAQPRESHIPERTFDWQPAMMLRPRNFDLIHIPAVIRPTVLLRRTETLKCRKGETSAVKSLRKPAESSASSMASNVIVISAQAGIPEIRTNNLDFPIRGNDGSAAVSAANDFCLDLSHILVSWRGMEHRISALIGPERIAAAWWSNTDFTTTRDYYRALTDQGLWLWIARDLLSDTWSVHGLWA